MASRIIGYFVGVIAAISIFCSVTLIIALLMFYFFPATRGYSWPGLLGDVLGLLTSVLYFRVSVRAAPAGSAEAGALLVMCAAGIVLFNFIIEFGRELARHQNVQIAVYTSSGALIFPIFVAGLFRIGERFRGSRSTTRIILGVAVLSLIGKLGNQHSRPAATTEEPVAQSKPAAAPIAGFVDAQDSGPGLRLKGIMCDSAGSSSAVINGYVVHVGETIAGWHVKAIETKSVTLEDSDGRTNILWFK